MNLGIELRRAVQGRRRMDLCITLRRAANREAVKKVGPGIMLRKAVQRGETPKRVDLSIRLHRAAQSGSRLIA